MYEISRGENFTNIIQASESRFAAKDWDEMTGIPVKYLQDGDMCYVNDVNLDYVYTADADETTGDFKPDDNEASTGYWVKTDPTFIELSLFQRIEAHVTKIDSNKRFISYSYFTDANLEINQDDTFLDLEIQDTNTALLKIRHEDSLKLEPGEYMIEVYTFIEDNSYESGFNLGQLPIQFVNVIDSTL